MEEKKCSSCHKIKPVDEFYTEHKSKDGLRYSCKECDKERNKNRDKEQITYKARVRRCKKSLVSAGAGELTHEIFDYFSKMGRPLTLTEMKQYVMPRVLQGVKDNNLLSVLTQLENKLGVGPKDYEFDFLSIMRNDRITSFKRGNGAGRGHKRAVNKLSLDGDFIERFESINDASDSIEGDANVAGNIVNCMRGKTAKSYGFVWEYAEI